MPLRTIHVHVCVRVSRLSISTMGLKSELHVGVSIQCKIRGNLYFTHLSLSLSLSLSSFHFLLTWFSEGQM